MVPNAQVGTVIHELAKRVLASEGRQEPRTTNAGPSIERAFTRLHDVMFTVVGTAGYKALFKRAVDLSKREHPWVAQLVVTEVPFAIGGIDAQVQAVGCEQATRGATRLFATLLDLFCTFIGTALTLQQVHHEWTDVGSPEGHETLRRDAT